MNGDMITMIGIINIMALTIYILVKEVVLPRRNNKRNNPNQINLSRFYQSFVDHKRAQEKFNDKIEKKIEKLDERIDNLEKRRK